MGSNKKGKNRSQGKEANINKNMKQNENNNEEQQLYEDERVKSIISEYEQKLKLLNQEKEKFNIEMGELRERLINEIKSKEEEIMEEHRQALLAQWEQEYNEKQLENKELHDKACRELEESREQAHKIICDAEKQKVEMLNNARMEIEEYFYHMSEEFEQKFKELIEKEKYIKEQQNELMIQQQDIEIEKDMLKSQQQQLKQQVERCLSAEIEELNQKIRILEELKERNEKRIQELVDENNQLKQLIDSDGYSRVEDILAELEIVKSENKELRDQLSTVPSPYELEELRKKADNLEALKRALQDEQSRRFEAEQRADSLSISAIELEQAKRVAETLKAINSQLQDELMKLNETYKQTTTSRFPGLLEIDAVLSPMPAFKVLRTNKSLKEIADYVRAYGSSELGLYYSEKTIRCFIASLAASKSSSKLIILQGLSGTGKSSLPKLFGKALSFGCSIIPVQPSWRDNRELLGYDNDFIRRFKETEFTKILYEASSAKNRERIWLIVLDEMNLARIEYYFADFLSILETEAKQWTVPLVASKEYSAQNNLPKELVDGTSLLVSQNIWFIGTANIDESTFGITDKVYDRAQVIDFKEREDEFRIKCNEKLLLSFSEFNDLVESAIRNNPLTREDHLKIKKLDEYLKENLDITFGNRIEKQMNRYVPVYVACGGSKEEAIDYLFAHKVLRKLENRYETSLIKDLKGLINEISNRYGNGTFVESIDLIEKKIRKLEG